MAVAGLALLLALASMREPPADPAGSADPAAATERTMAPAGEVGSERARPERADDDWSVSGWADADVEVGPVDEGRAWRAGRLPRRGPPMPARRHILAESGGDRGALLDEGEAGALALRLAGRLAGQMTGQVTGQVTGAFVVGPFGVGRAGRRQRPATLDTVVLDQSEH